MMILPDTIRPIICANLGVSYYTRNTRTATSGRYLQLQAMCKMHCSQFISIFYMKTALTAFSCRYRLPEAVYIFTSFVPPADGLKYSIKGNIMYVIFSPLHIPLFILPTSIRLIYMGSEGPHFQDNNSV